MIKKFSQARWLVRKAQLAIIEGVHSVSDFVDFLRFRMGFTYNDCAKLFNEAAQLDGQEFEALMQDCDDCEKSREECE